MKKHITTLSIFVYGTAFVLFTFILQKQAFIGPWTLAAEDLSAIYTGLGFVGLVAMFRHEREKAKEDDEDHAKLMSEMRAQVKATRQAARVTALSVLLEHYAKLLPGPLLADPTIVSQNIGQQEMNEKHQRIKKALEEAAITTDLS